MGTSFTAWWDSAVAGNSCLREVAYLNGKTLRGQLSRP